MVSKGDPATADFFEKLDLVNNFCAHFDIESEKARTLREYMHQTRYELRAATECERLFDLLSPHLLQVRHAA